MNRAIRVAARTGMLAVLVLSFGLLISTRFALAATTDQWTTSLHDVSRDGASTDTNITTSNVDKLSKQWSLATGSPIASQPAIVNGVAYVGSWNGYEYAINISTGAVLWKTNLGTTFGGGNCDPQGAGVSSAPTVLNGVLYVGGGNQYWYALNASTGAVEWKVLTGNASGTYDGHYNWSSPLIVGNDAYVGVASLGDCPLVQGQLLKVDLTAHTIVSTLDLVPNGQVGGGIWTSPSYDPATGEIYTVTGTEENDQQTYAQAVVGINASSMTVVDYWHLPETQAVSDSDWTTSVLLYTDSSNRQLALATNKNGTTYAFLRSDLAAGPVWQRQIAIGNDCAACGYSTVSSAALGQGQIYQAGGVTTINGKGYGGSVQAWNPATGAVVWQHPEAGPVIGAVTYDNGMVIAGAGSAIEVLNATNGRRLYSYDTGAGSWIYAAPAVSDGVIITGNTAGTIYALGLGSKTTPPTDANCPSGWTCQDIGSPTPSGSETVTSGTWNVAAGGGGVGGTSDAFRLLSEPSAGNVQIKAQVTAQQGISSGSQAGIMLRQSNKPGSPYYAVLLTPNGVEVIYRNTFGAASTTVTSTYPGKVPLYLEIQRVNDTLQAATSTDGKTYTLVPGATATVIMPYASLAGLAASSGLQGTSGTATFANVSVGTPSDTLQNTPPASACPSGWNCGDIGDPLTVGNQSLSGGTWSIQGAGTGVDGFTDQMHYVWQTITADTTLTARMTAQSGTGTGDKAGLMMRTDTSAGSAYYGVFIEPDGTAVVQDRTTNSLPIFETLATFNDTLPQYIQIVRTGTTFMTYTSSDGVNWQPVVGSQDTVSSLGGTILAGLAVTSGNAAAASTVTADNVSVATGGNTPPTECPVNWTCQDVGSPIPAGSQYYYNGTWSVLAGGKDIWGTYDEMRLVAENMTGDGSVSVRVASQGDTDPWAKAGLMIRDSTDEGGAYFAIFTTPETNGTVIQYRPTDGAATTQITGVASKAPIYLKITRSGSTFTAYTSTDGNTWTAFPNGSVSIPAIPSSALVGMASTSHSQFGTNTVAFDHFTLTPVNTSLPSPWVDNDLDNATPAGSASYAGGVFTVNGGGNDIWGTPYGNLDQSHYVSQTVSGNSTIIARVASQTNSSAWAKAGIMIKQSATADAPYALLAVTPGNGIAFQSNFNASVSGGAFTLPEWLKLSRVGNTVTAFTSPDGATWTQVGTATVTLNDPITVGLFVCSHNAGALSTATFDNVSVTSP